MTDKQSLPELRLELVEARARLRQAELLFDGVKASGTQAILNNFFDPKVLGPTVEDRQRRIGLMLADNPEFNAAEKGLLDARHEVDMLTALVANAEDERQDAGRASRDKLADAMGAFRDPARNFYLTPDLVEAVVERLAERIRVDMERGTRHNTVDVTVSGLVEQRPAIAHSSSSA